MNTLNDFVKGSIWSDGFVELRFEQFDKDDGLPLFSCDKDHGYITFNIHSTNHEDEIGLIGFGFKWKEFKRVKK